MKYHHRQDIFTFDIFTGNKLYICGGACSAMGYMLHSMEVYDATAGKFDRTAPDCPLPGRFLSLIAVPPYTEH